ncbi:hypothetical protein GCM10009120_49750 [Sphingobacterium siyangense subsp. cladoniae]|uniref:FeoB-associated Cys-rich membrane protein n=1 Tax=Sphingobacterium siyangense TaxID=459529 RepID=UPI0031F8FDB6
MEIIQEVKGRLKHGAGIMKRRNRLDFVVWAIILVIAAFVIYKMTTFSLFDSEVKRLVEFDVPEQDYKLRVYHIPSNATMLDYIQVRKFKNNKEDILENYKRYDSLVSYLLSDTSLELRIINTVQMKSRIDTMILRLK